MYPDSYRDVGREANVILSHYIDFKFIKKQENKNVCVRTISTFTFQQINLFFINTSNVLKISVLRCKGRASLRNISA